jgi:putative ABC transport system permease protein
MTGLLRDLRLSARSLARHPKFALTAILTLGLGIGATVSVFSVVRAVLLQPLPFEDPGTLVNVWTHTTGVEKGPPLVKDLNDFREQGTLFEGFGGRFSAWVGTLTDRDEPETIRMAPVTVDFFSLLGVKPHLGRLFEDADGSPFPEAAEDSVPPTDVLILSHRYWQSHFGGDPSVIGRVIEINNRPAEVVGVMPRDFTLLPPADVLRAPPQDGWQPVRADLTGRIGPNLRLVGRIRAGVTVEQAQAQIDAIAARQRAEVEVFERNQRRPVLYPLHEDGVRHVQAGLWFLSGAVGLLLLLTCANVANLLVVRSRGMRRDFAIRGALGSDRWTLTRGLLVESSLLAVLAAGLGIALTYAATRAIAATSPEQIPLLDRLVVDAATLGVAVLSACLVTLLFGLLPSVRAARVQVTESLKDHVGATGGSRRWGPLSVLVVTEVALSMVLLTGAGLLVRTMVSLQRVDPGFDADPVLTVRVHVWGERYGSPEARVAFRDQLETRLAGLPGVEAVSHVWPIPMEGSFQTVSYEIHVDGGDRTADARWTRPGYFRAMGTPLLAGRDFVPEESRGEPEVVIVDENLAEARWPGTPPAEVVNQLLTLRFGDNRPQFRVVGVVANSRSVDLGRESRETVYRPEGLRPGGVWQTVIRASSDPANLIAAVRRELRDIDPTLPIYQVATMRERVDRSLAPMRFVLALVSSFAVMALFLAALGLYGVISFAISQRTAEIGIRMTLGAGKRDILGMILREGGRLTLLGLGLGGVGILFVRGGIESMLYGVAPLDPGQLLITAVVLGLVSLAACLVPARKASRTDPLQAIRTG